MVVENEDNELKHKAEVSVCHGKEAQCGVDSI